MNRFPSISKLLALSLLAVVPVSLAEPNATAVTRKFIGTWRLASRESNGQTTHPTGLIYYDHLGNMAVQIMSEQARPKYAGPQATPDEAKAALTGYTAYFGTYTVDEKARTVTHHRKGNINPGGIDDGVRHYEFTQGDRLVLTPDANPGTHLEWERLK